MASHFYISVIIMGIKVYFYRFKKRSNSTKRPGDGSTSVAMPHESECIIKGTCSIMNPSLQILTPNIEERPFQYNYCYIPDFERYYYISDWTFSNRLWTCTLKEDMLATYKVSIGNSTQYVIRSSNQHDDTIIDNTYIAKSSYQVVNEERGNIWVKELGRGFYVLGIIGGSKSSDSDTSTSGAVTYWVLSQTQFNKLSDYLFGDESTSIGSSAELSQEDKLYFNPMQYIVSCQWFPISIGLVMSDYVGDDLSTFRPSMGTANIKLGWYETNISASYLTSTVFGLTFNIDIPKSPFSDRGRFTNLAPFANYILRFYPFGDISLDPSLIVGYDNLVCDLVVDLISGTSRCTIRHKADSDYRPVVTENNKISNSIPLAQVSYDYQGKERDNTIYTAQANISDINYARTITNGSIDATEHIIDITDPFKTPTPQQKVNSGLEAGRAVANTVYDCVDNHNNWVITSANYDYQTRTRMPQVNSTPTGGGVGAITNDLTGDQIHLYGLFYKPVDEDLDNLGRPLFKKVQIRTIPGYIQCANVHCELETATTTANDQEEDVVTGYLEAGFFYE